MRLWFCVFEGISKHTALSKKKWKEFLRECIRVCEIIFMSFCFKGQQFFFSSFASQRNVPLSSFPQKAGKKKNKTVFPFSPILKASFHKEMTRPFLPFIHVWLLKLPGSQRHTNTLSIK